tara:strand:+ start:113957 stop:114994 length:1038 start_codon:yes stop_codon:yes gene_type:complete
MKTTTLLVLFLLFFTVNLHAQNFNSPVDYLEFIGKEQTSISKSMWNYNKSIAHSRKAKRIDATRNQLVKTIQAAKNKIEKLEDGYNGDMDYHVKILDYLTISENMINNDYEKIIDMKEIAEQSYDLMEAYIKTQESINEKYKNESDKVVAAQTEFAKKYNINLIEDENDLSKKLKISNEVFSYQNQLYLIFFKANFTFGQLNEALALNDITAIQQNGNTLEFYAKEGLEAIENIEAYNKDVSLLNTTRTSLQYFEKSAVNYTNQVIDFLEYNIQFEEIKNALERKSEKKRTKEEVDRYNKMVGEINKKVKSYNTANQKFINDVNRLNQQWDNTSSQFVAKHIPKD